MHSQTCKRVKRLAKVWFNVIICFKINASGEAIKKLFEVIITRLEILPWFFSKLHQGLTIWPQVANAIMCDN